MGENDDKEEGKKEEGEGDFVTGQGSLCHGSFRICALLPPCSRTPIEHGSPGIRLPLFWHICTERGLTALRGMQIVRQIEGEWV